MAAHWTCIVKVHDSEFITDFALWGIEFYSVQPVPSPWGIETERQKRCIELRVFEN